MNIYQNFKSPRNWLTLNQLYMANHIGQFQQFNLSNECKHHRLSCSSLLWNNTHQIIIEPFEFFVSWFACLIRSTSFSLKFVTVLIKVFSRSICMLESIYWLMSWHKIRSLDLLFKLQLLSTMAGAVNVNFWKTRLVEMPFCIDVSRDITQIRIQPFTVTRPFSAHNGKTSYILTYLLFA